MNIKYCPTIVKLIIKVLTINCEFSLWGLVSTVSDSQYNNHKYYNVYTMILLKLPH